MKSLTTLVICLSVMGFCIGSWCIVERGENMPLRKELSALKTELTEVKEQYIDERIRSSAASFRARRDRMRRARRGPDSVRRARA